MYRSILTTNNRNMIAKRIEAVKTARSRVVRIASINPEEMLEDMEEITRKSPG